jgi:hypothetical protein
MGPEDDSFHPAQPCRAPAHSPAPRQAAASVPRLAFGLNDDASYVARPWVRPTAIPRQSVDPNPRQGSYSGDDASLARTWSHSPALRRPEDSTPQPGTIDDAPPLPRSFSRSPALRQVRPVAPTRRRSSPILPHTASHFLSADDRSPRDGSTLPPPTAAPFPRSPHSPTPPVPVAAVFPQSTRRVNPVDTYERHARPVAKAPSLGRSVSPTLCLRTFPVSPCLSPAGTTPRAGHTPLRASPRPLTPALRPPSYRTTSPALSRRSNSTILRTPRNRDDFVGRPGIFVEQY